ncbi:hypothetical protein QQX98_000417 [Neonectria punicea]|uniref:C2H2-type domain-containing protein n=1 Tax=Neonectria punicea TaxID=979145 RepID=A0ABR1HT97_9HYPO
MSVKFGTHDFLEYDARYSVLICRTCKYAVQKGALERHLLRHKIYRGEKQRLMSAIARLELVEPDHVQLPPAGSPPVDGLPVISGYKCTAAGCGRLYASSKRMRRHWSESHGVSDPAESAASSVALQTFFRGTKLRYFEVMVPTASSTAVVATTATEERPLVSTPSPSPCHLDLETLRYFHHFTTMTSLTLPVQEGGPAKYWQTDVTSQALRLHWLMCGLLAISASHLATLYDDKTKQAHRSQAARYLQEFSAGWEEAIQRGPRGAEIEGVKTGAQMICIQRCCHWTLDDKSPTLGQSQRPFQLQLFITIVQGCVDPSFALRCLTTDDDNDNVLEETFVSARNDSEATSDAGDSSKVPSELLERFRAIPYLMALLLGKPDSTEDFVATLSAIKKLVNCSYLSYASNDVRAVWMGMEAWLKRISDRFKRMLWHENPAALLVLANWSLLVERAKRLCWFLSGMAIKVLREVERHLPEDSIVQSIIENQLSDKLDILNDPSFM